MNAANSAREQILRCSHRPTELHALALSTRARRASTRGALPGRSARRRRAPSPRGCPHSRRHQTSSTPYTQTVRSSVSQRRPRRHSPSKSRNTRQGGRRVGRWERQGREAARRGGACGSRRVASSLRRCSSCSRRNRRRRREHRQTQLQQEEHPRRERAWRGCHRRWARSHPRSHRHRQPRRHSPSSSSRRHMARRPRPRHHEPSRRHHHPSAAH